MAVSTSLFGLAAIAFTIGDRALVIGLIMVVAGPIIQFVSLKIAARFYRAGANLFCSAIIACIVVWNVALGHGHATLVGYALCCLAAGLLMNLRTSLVYALVGLSVYVVIGYLQANGAVSWAIDPSEAVFLAINQRTTRSIHESVAHSSEQKYVTNKSRGSHTRRQ